LPWAGYFIRKKGNFDKKTKKSGFKEITRIYRNHFYIDIDIFLSDVISDEHSIVQVILQVIEQDKNDLRTIQSCVLIQKFIGFSPLSYNIIN